MAVACRLDRYYLPSTAAERLSGGYVETRTRFGLMMLAMKVQSASRFPLDFASNVESQYFGREIEAMQASGKEGQQRVRLCSCSTWYAQIPQKAWSLGRGQSLVRVARGHRDSGPSSMLRGHECRLGDGGASRHGVEKSKSKVEGEGGLQNPTF